MILKKDDPRVELAANLARRHFEVAVIFLERGRIDSIQVKKRFTDNEKSELAWVTVEKIEEDTLTGKLDNELQFCSGPTIGSIVVIKKNEIMDWMGMCKQGIFGNFTLRVLLEYLDDDQKEEALNVLAPMPESMMKPTA